MNPFVVWTQFCWSFHQRNKEEDRRRTESLFCPGLKVQKRAESLFLLWFNFIESSTNVTRKHFQNGLHVNLNSKNKTTPDNDKLLWGFVNVWSPTEERLLLTCPGIQQLLDNSSSWNWWTAYQTGFLENPVGSTCMHMFVYGTAHLNPSG